MRSTYVKRKRMKKEKVDAHIVIRLQFKITFGRILCAAVTLSHNIWSERKFKCRKSILTTYLEEDFFKNNLIHLQTKHSPWIQQDFLSWADLPLASVEGLDLKPCKPPLSSWPYPHRPSSQAHEEHLGAAGWMHGLSVVNQDKVY